jgi:lysophospholipase L1-like esterase
MRLSRLLLIGALVAGSVTGASLSAQAAGPATYYLALGDSLSVGFQPGLGDTNASYPDQLFTNYLAPRDPNLVLVKMGCSGETTATMINGGHCTDGRYTTGSQLGDAEAFLAAHGSAVKYLTIDIGANDVDGCAPGGSIDAACLAAGAKTIATNLLTILAGLKHAGGNPLKIGMTYYDPFLAEWLTGTTGQVVATASVTALIGINNTMVSEFAAYGFKVADVFTAYKSANFTIRNFPTYGRIPTNVDTICVLTYMCTLSNIHPNPTGYGVIAATFAHKIP